MVVTSPIHTTRIGRGILRVFHSPRTGADLPWHCADDLPICLGLPDDVRQKNRERLANSEFAAETDTNARMA